MHSFGFRVINGDFLGRSILAVLECFVDLLLKNWLEKVTKFAYSAATDFVLAFLIALGIC